MLGRTRLNKINSKKIMSFSLFKFLPNPKDYVDVKKIDAVAKHPASKCAGLTFAALNCVRASLKAIRSPHPGCKVLYVAAASLNGVACATNGLSLLSPNSVSTSVPFLLGTVSYCTSLAGEYCDSIGDCMAGRPVDPRLNEITKSL